MSDDADAMTSFLALLLPALLVGEAHQYVDPHDLLTRLIDRYARATSVTVSFREAGDGSALHGTLITKGTTKYRLELPDRLIVCNGTTVWSYVPDRKAVTIDTVRHTGRALSPEFFLARLPGDAHATLVARPTPATAVLALEPPNPDAWGLVRRLEVTMDVEPPTIRSVRFTTADGTVRVVNVTGTRLSMPIPDARFSFTPAAGMEVIDMR